MHLMSMNPSISSIESLFELYSHIFPDITKESSDSSLDSQSKIKVLAWDFDHVLGISEALATSDYLNDFMLRMNKEKGRHKNAHDPLLLKMREHTPFKTCEDPKELRSMIDKAREEGWKVVILTSRPKNMLSVTLKNITEMGLSSFSRQDILFRSESVHDTKVSRLYMHLKTMPAWDKSKKIEVIFIDDKKFYCENVASLSSLLDNRSIEVEVKTFHYLKAAVIDKLTKEQLPILAVQFAAYKEFETIPFDNEINQEMVSNACEYLKISESDLTEESIYNIIKDVAEARQVPFDAT